MSMNTEIYQDISTRTAGDIYIGVVGPVRAGKSTFIKRFMGTQVIPKSTMSTAASGRRMSCRRAAAAAW